MSCEILIELDKTSQLASSLEGRANNISKSDNYLPTSNRNSNKQDYDSGNRTNRSHRFNSWFPNLIINSARIICYQRLKIIKFFMATFLTLFTLFLLLRNDASTVTSSSSEIKLAFSEHSDRYNSDTKINPNDSSNQYDEDVEAQSKKQLYILKDGNHVIMPPHQYYPSNVTYSLSSSDFNHISMNLMQVRIKEAAKHSWDSYRRYAWGFDMLKPRAMEPDHWFDLGLTIVDSVDTLIMLGLENEANAAIDWIENELKFDSHNENSNCFELTIRILGGILTAQHLTRHDKLKEQAIKIGDILLHCYDTESKVIPYSDIDLGTKRAHPPTWNPYSSLSEVASLQIEFRYLSQISQNSHYEGTTFQTSLHLHNLVSSRRSPLLPMYIHPSTGELQESIITLGARTDSYYEYLLKQYLQTGIKWLETDYLNSVDEMERYLFKFTGGVQNYTYVAEIQIFKTANDTDDIKHFNKMDHLVCFLPGTLTLGYYHFSPEASEYRLKYNLETPNEKINDRYTKHLKMAKDLARTCYHMYKDMGTGLSGEIATFVNPTPPINDGNNNVSSLNSFENQIPDQHHGNNQRHPLELQTQSNSAHNILRPEFIESLFYLYHVTGLPMYRSQGEEVFEAFQKYSRIASGYTPVSDVRLKPKSASDLYKDAPDRMESFWLSETLKYFYLLFTDDPHIIGTLLNNYIFNTEGHILPIVQK